MTSDRSDQLPETLALEYESDALPADRSSFPVVGVGASAGGLEAVTQLLKALPVGTGMSFVIVQHLAPSHPSALAEILARATKMPVIEIEDMMTVERNRVYVIPPDRSVIIVHRKLKLMQREGRGAHHPIDQFFRSLAEEQRHQAVGVVLSGTASDGTLGLEAIKGEGGITFAQDSSALHDGMPQNAIASGCVDFVLSPDGIARELARMAKIPSLTQIDETSERESKPNITQILQLVRHTTGVDFTDYKFNTLYRRIVRRMIFQKIDELSDYIHFLRRTPTEIEALYQDILINVTSFFRDQEAFEALKQQVFRRLLNRTRRDPVRIWALGCSTGQEAYSLAIAFTEAAEDVGRSVPFQIFATDLNEVGITKGRAGVYSKDIAQDVSPSRLRRFFHEVDGHYRISKSIRDACIFSRHNILSDPPFSHMDLISCRNVLIYMEPVLQQLIIPTLHYALQPEGYLWLGGSESIGTYRNLFELKDASHKIHLKKITYNQDHSRFPMQSRRAPFAPFTVMNARHEGGTDLNREADRLLLSKFAPPGVLVSSELEILQFRGDTSLYISPTPGKASLNLLKMLREGLLVGVRAAIARADKEGSPIREEGLRVKSDTGHLDVAIEVIPVKASGGKEGGFLILFENAHQASEERKSPSYLDHSVTQNQLTVDSQNLTPSLHDNARLEQELATTRDYLQSVIEQQESYNEELQSANEEIQSANEELQSTNEELETSKEEIQSSNEELATVNDELNYRNAELNQLNNDLVNLFSSIQTALVLVGPDLRIRRITPAAEKMFNILQTDVGRPLADISFNLVDMPPLEPLIAQVLDTVSIKECEVRDKEGRWYSMRLRPYRTLDNKIDGVILMLVDVDLLKRSLAYTESIVATVREPLLVLDASLHVRSASASFYMTYLVRPEQTINRLLFDLGNGQWNIPELRRVLEEVLPRDNQVDDFEVEHTFERIGAKVMRLNARRLVQMKEHDPLILLAIEDITEHKRQAHELHKYAAELSAADHRKNEFLAMLAHELRNPLAPIRNALEVLRSTKNSQPSFQEDEATQSAYKLMERQLGQMVRLVDDLLDVSRISRGKSELRRERIELASVIYHAVDACRPTLSAANHDFNIAMPQDPIVVDADPTRLSQIVGNLLNNACKFTDKGGHIELTVEQVGEQAIIRVRDNGIGLGAEQIPHIFEMFMQVDTSLERTVSGLGIGLTLVKTLVEMHGGTIEVHSAGIGQGSEFVVRLPIVSDSTIVKTKSIDVEPTNSTARRILVVDDNRDSASTLAMLLKLYGHETQSAFDGLEALEVAETFMPDVILLDIGLPKLNGYEVCRRIREKPWGAKMVLIALTGWGQEEDRQKSKAAGFDAHLTKPVEHAALKKLLVEL